MKTFFSVLAFFVVSAFASPDAKADAEADPEPYYGYGGLYGYGRPYAAAYTNSYFYTPRPVGYGGHSHGYGGRSLAYGGHSLGYGGHFLGKRDAEASPEAEADPGYGYYSSHRAYGGHLRGGYHGRPYGLGYNYGRGYGHGSGYPYLNFISELIRGHHLIFRNMERNEIVNSTLLDKELPDNWTSLDRSSSNHFEEDNQAVSKGVESINPCRKSTWKRKTCKEILP
ncbi:unnamed protein product [Lepeophtheirus salmonis]|uniref:(salmon louse) hypothetical protein n=1 Tax=Lepeophtheirus salmonis TaxID=72036 RepID=A0A7R8H743_LEPSM|nr:unnamed protein product [Lepeophtheirus salmonis]CAF2915930.1 unnamed protein product [Lepeophtheirus salmonis]